MPRLFSMRYWSPNTLVRISSTLSEDEVFDRVFEDMIADFEPKRIGDHRFELRYHYGRLFVENWRRDGVKVYGNCEVFPREQGSTIVAMISGSALIYFCFLLAHISTVLVAFLATLSVVGVFEFEWTHLKILIPVATISAVFYLGFRRARNKMIAMLKASLSEVTA